MSTAFEITRDDIETVLGAHGVTDAGVIDRADDLVAEEDFRIEEAALAYDSMEFQTSGAYCEMEDIFIEAGILPAGTAKKWNPPEGEDYSDFEDEEET